jgi:hypothetical protein
MHALGVPTTRAGSLVTSDTRVARDINYDGNVIQERASVRAASAPPRAAPPPRRRRRRAATASAARLTRRSPRARRRW